MKKTLESVVNHVTNYGFVFEKYTELPLYGQRVYEPIKVAVLNYNECKYAIWRYFYFTDAKTGEPNYRFHHIKLKENYELTPTDPYLLTNNSHGHYALSKLEYYANTEVYVTFNSIFDEVVKISLNREDDTFKEKLEITSRDPEVRQLAFQFCQGKCPLAVLLDKLKDKYTLIPIL